MDYTLNMNRCTLPLLGCLLLALPLLPPPAAFGQQPAKASINPAISYEAAFAAMPEMTKQGLDILQQWRRVPVDTAVQELVGGCVESHKHLYAAMSSREECDWGLDLKTGGLDVAIPHVGPAAALAKITLLRSRKQMGDRQSVKAASDILAVRRMARDVATPECLITATSSYAIESMALDMLEDEAHRLSTTTKRRLATAFQSLDPLVSPDRVIDKERVYYDWMRAELEKAEREKRTVVVAKDLFKRLGAPLPFQQLQSFERTWRRDIDKCDELQQELVRLVKDGRGKTTRELAAFEKQRNTWPIIARLMVPQVGGLIRKHSDLQKRAGAIGLTLQR